MSTEIIPQTGNTSLAAHSESIEEFRIRLENFTNKLNQLPNPGEIDKTPDGKANSIPISFIEMTLDEFFFGQWDTHNFKWSVIANEVVGSIDLSVLHPVSGREIKRVGAACVQIMVDSVPDNIKNDKQARNAWALNPNNKKAGALDMGFPKLKAECLKNAAQSLGKLFGRDLNRKKQDVFTPIISQRIEAAKKAQNSYTNGT